MRTSHVRRVDATVFGAASVLALAMAGSQAVHAGAGEPSGPRTGETPHPTPAGVWSSADGSVRLKLSPDGTYERSVAGRREAARGAYHADGTDILLADDTGLHTTVVLDHDVLEMAGHRLRRA